MSIKLFNTIKRKKELFKPLKKGKVSLYTCGPTVYDYAHIGNFRTFIFEDILKRWLLYSGFKVNHIMNITDVDDKTIKKSNNENIKLSNLTKFYELEFKKDIDWLRIINADLYPRATESISKIISIISKLLEKKYAYVEKDGSVYFKINSYEKYGQLSKIKLIKSENKKNNLNDEYSKESMRDFALWKIHKPSDGPVFWDSPWGKGRPGWHIECSAMSIEHLGVSFDIHCGGVDNIFPHHENEIAQSECFSEKKFVNYWMHSEHLMIEDSKMSKSEGNTYTLNTLEKHGFSPGSLRYLLTAGHYRTKITFSLDSKTKADKVIKRIRSFADRLKELGADKLKLNNLKSPNELELFKQHMNDDLNTPNAYATFFNYMRLINKKIDQKGLSESDLECAWHFLNDFNQIFDLVNLNSIDLPISIKNLLKLRQSARSKGNWADSDNLRLKISEMGFNVQDTKSGQLVTRKSK